MGINVPLTKAMSFGVSALYTGLSGSLAALTTAYVAPDTFSLMLSVFFLVGVVVGGLGTILGALFGAAFIQFMPPLAEHISKSAPSAIFGLFLILCMFVMPKGVSGLLGTVGYRLRALIDRKP